MKKLILLLPLMACLTPKSDSDNYLECVKACESGFNACARECNDVKDWCIRTGFTDGFCEKKFIDCSTKCDSQMREL